MRISNYIGLKGLSIITMILSLLTLISLLIYSHLHPISFQCHKIVALPFYGYISCFLLAISIYGFCGSICWIASLLWIYVFGLFITPLACLSFTIFVLLVTNKDASNMVSKIRVGDYRIGNYYNDWVQNHVVNGHKWEGVREFCLVESQICHSLHHGNLTSIQSSCCKPPTLCKFTEKSTYWEWEGPPSSMESDCKTWSNDEDKLCYNCKSCKASFEANLKKKWPLYFSINFIILAIMLFIHNISFRVVIDRLWYHLLRS